MLVENLTAQLAKELELPYVPTIESSALKVMSTYGWPGNIRELRNVLERAISLGKGCPITPDLLDLPKEESAEDDKKVTTIGEYFQAPKIGRARRDRSCQGLFPRPTS